MDKTNLLGNIDKRRDGKDAVESRVVGVHNVDGNRVGVALAELPSNGVAGVLNPVADLR